MAFVASRSIFGYLHHQSPWPERRSLAVLQYIWPFSGERTCCALSSHSRRVDSVEDILDFGPVHPHEAREEQEGSRIWHALRALRCLGFLYREKVVLSKKTSDNLWQVWCSCFMRTLTSTNEVEEKSWESSTWYIQSQCQFLIPSTNQELNLLSGWEQSGEASWSAQSTYGAVTLRHRTKMVSRVRRHEWER